MSNGTKAASCFEVNILEFLMISNVGLLYAFELRYSVDIIKSFGVKNMIPVLTSDNGKNFVLFIGKMNQHTKSLQTFARELSSPNG
jgi:hypothetical protein